VKANFARTCAGLASIAGLLLVILPAPAAEAQWVFVARKAAQRIHHMVEQGQNGQPGYDFATVILEAPADKVFTVALDHAQKNRGDPGDHGRSDGASPAGRGR
jgi:hypothetical protein